MLTMTKIERRTFVDWRDPKYDGPFSCIAPGGIRWTWLPEIGIVPAENRLAQMVWN